MNTTIILLSALCFSPISPNEGVVSSHFGYRVYPGSTKKTLHVGVDIAAMHGEPIHSVTEGVVIFAGVDPDGGGLIVEILTKHRGRLKIIRYFHMSRIFAKSGWKVRRDQIIGRVGSTGRSTGPHVHIEIAIVRNGQKPEYEDPAKFLCEYKEDIKIPHFDIDHKFTLKKDKRIYLRNLNQIALRHVHH